MNGFLPDEKVKVDEQFRRDAKALSDILIKGHRLTRGLGIDRAAAILSKVSSKRGFSNYKTVFDWFIRNALNKYIPRITSAKQFESKFSRLLKTMESQYDPIHKIQIREQTKILNVSLGLIWPHNWDEQRTLEFVQRCFDTYSEFRRKLKVMLAFGALIPLIQYLLIKEMSVWSFVREWVIDANRWVWKFNDSTKINPQVCSIESKKFYMIVQGWCNEFTSDQPKIQKFLKEISK